MALGTILATPESDILKPKLKKKVTILEPNEESEEGSDQPKSSSKSKSRDQSPKLEETPDLPDEITIPDSKLEKGKSQIVMPGTNIMPAPH